MRKVNGKTRSISHTAMPDYTLPSFNAYQFYLQMEYDRTFGLNTADKVLNRQIDQHRKEFEDERRV